MPTLPSARTRISPVAVALAAALGYIVVTGPVTKNPDAVPRLFSDAQAILDQHDYSEAAEYAALHIAETGTPVIFVGIPVATAGVLRYVDTAGNTGTSLPSVAAASSGYTDAIDFVGTVTKGGVVGTNGIELTYSCDGGRTTRTIRLGTSTSFAIPYLGAVVSFAAGSLVEGDVFLRFRTTAPRWDGAGIDSVRTSLAAQSKASRSWMVCGDVKTSVEALQITTPINTYETTNRRFCNVRASVRDEILSSLPRASKRRVNMTGAPTLTFAEVGLTGDTITRSAGSWITDGFAVGHVIYVTGTVSNNIVAARIASLTSTVITLDTDDLAPEGPVSGCSVSGSPGLTFAEVGVTGDTVTRSSGSWLDEGFEVGQTVKFTGTLLNNVTAVISALTATVMTFGSEDLAPEVAGSHLVTVERVLSKASAVSAAEVAFASVRPQKRIDLAYGRGRKLSPITGWFSRRPSGWAASIREYQHDLHITTWWVDLGGLDGWSLKDADGTTVEHDDFLDGQGATAAGFTSLRTWPDEDGVFVAMSLTRASEGDVLQLTNNMAVTDLTCTVVQRTLQKSVGQSLLLTPEGLARESELTRIEQRVNTELRRALLTDNGGEGQRASEASFRATRGTVLNVPGAKLMGRTKLLLNGVVHEVDTWVDVVTNGAGVAAVA